MGFTVFNFDFFRRLLYTDYDTVVLYPLLRRLHRLRVHSLEMNRPMRLIGMPTHGMEYPHIIARDVIFANSDTSNPFDVAVEKMKLNVNGTVYIRNGVRVSITDSEIQCDGLRVFEGALLKLQRCKIYRSDALLTNVNSITSDTDAIYVEKCNISGWHRTLLINKRGNIDIVVNDNVFGDLLHEAVLQIVDKDDELVTKDVLRGNISNNAVEVNKIYQVHSP